MKHEGIGLTMGDDDLMYERRELRAPELITVTDLGSGNRGGISAADLTGEQREKFITDLRNPEYWRFATSTFRCVDGRIPEDGLEHEQDNEADPQGAGGEAVFEVAIDYMTERNASQPLSQKVPAVVGAARKAGRDVVVHGDTHNGKAGCLANKRKREILLENARNIDVVAPRVWFLAQHAGLDEYVTEDDVLELIETGAENAKNEALWDLTPEQFVNAAIKAGARYEELIDEHNEKAILADLSEDTTLDEEHFMSDHQLSDGTPLEAFVASIGVYKKHAFEDAELNGQDKVFAARRVLAFIAFNIGVPKEACAEEQGNGESLPVVIVK